ncbi:MAG: sugar phosphate isomerase/epimerase [Kiritimatiellae bacterium]|nr:sugar phosphate isomerase/epimerase [Kiritimatiellia bacterium]
MKLGAGTFAWARAGLDMTTALQEIAGLGIRYVDVLGAMHGHPLQLGRIQKKAIRKHLDDFGLTASSLLAVDKAVNIAMDDKHGRDDVRDYFKASMEFANELGLKQVLVKPGDKSIDLPNSKAWANAVAFSLELAEMFGEAGLHLTYELEWRTCGLVQTVEQMETMLADVDMPNVWANVDLGHAALAREGVEDLARIADRTIHLHLSDNDTFLHTNDIPGTAAVPFARYIRAIAPRAEDACREIGETLVAGIEIELDEGDTRQPADIVRQAKDWILANVPEVEL